MPPGLVLVGRQIVGSRSPSVLRRFEQVTLIRLPGLLADTLRRGVVGWRTCCRGRSPFCSLNSPRSGH